MAEPIVFEQISDDDFVEIYKPVDARGEGDQIVDTVEEAQALASKNGLGENNIWTIVDAEGNLYAAAGLHFVNRLGYVVTEKPWVTGNEEAVWCEFEDDDEEDEDDD